MKNLNNKANALILPFLPLLFAVGIILLIIVIVVGIALWATVGWIFVIGLILLFLDFYLLITKHLNPKQALILGIIAFILMFISYLGILEIGYFETTFQTFPQFTEVHP